MIPLEIPELAREDGRPGVVYIRLLSAGDVLDYVEKDELTQREQMFSLIAKAVVKQDGSPMFDEAEVFKLRNLRVDVFTRLSKAVTATINPDDPESKKLESTGDSPIDSQLN